MSGGAFDYKQSHIDGIADNIEYEILVELGLIQDGETPRDLKPETIMELIRAYGMLKDSYIWTKRIDWLLSGDDSERTFHERLRLDGEKARNEIKGKIDLWAAKLKERMPSE